jgi:hypothetical protein
MTEVSEKPTLQDVFHGGDRFDDKESVVTLLELRARWQKDQESLQRDVFIFGRE